MFHRVKSEGQTTEPVQNNEEPKKAEAANTKPADITNLKPAETPSTDETPAATTKAEEQPQQKISNPQKEATKMSQEKQETPTETPEAPIDASTSSYQRAGTAPANVTGYPGAYPSYGAQAGKEANAASGDRRLTIGAGITMSGEIESCDYLLVEGTVEAALKGASVLDIADSGVFYGTVEIDDATIAGRFEGDITAHGRLTLREGATVTGTIAYKELEIEAGAVIDGKLTPLNAVQSAKKPVPAKKEAPAKAGKENKAQSEAKPEPANNDGELFSKAATAAE